MRAPDVDDDVALVLVFGIMVILVFVLGVRWARDCFEHQWISAASKGL